VFAVSDDQRFGPFRRDALKLLLLGLAVLAGHFVLAALTTIGDPGDIGGGLILLIGYLVTGAGVFCVGKDLRDHWSQRK
jgi:hypothetical protein